MTVTDMLGLYLEHHAPHTADDSRIRYAIRNLVPWWDGVTVSGITAGACRRYAAESTRAPATIRRELGTLAAAMNWCVTEGRLTKGGIVVLPMVPKDEQPFLTRPQAAKLLWKARRLRKAWRRHHFRREEGGELFDNLYLPLFILIGLYQGARKEAILSLQWQPNTEGGYVDLDRGFIDFNPVGRAQSKKRRARVPIAARLLPWLRVARKITRQYVLECHGQPLGDLKASFATAAKAAGMPNVHPHTLRHTCVTWLLRDGLDVWQVGGFVGMSPQTVQQVYGHHAPEFMAEAAASRRGRAETGIYAGIKTIRA
jgi:integrase